MDYVALGHLHGPQQPRSKSRTVLRYSGSPLRYSFSERAQRKTVTVVDLAADGTVGITEAPLQQPRPMADLRGTLAELTTGSSHAAHLDDWVRVTVTDRSRPDQMFDRVKARFPHVLQVFHIPAGSQPAGQLTLDVRVEYSARELGGDFVQHVSGLPADAQELDLFERAYHAAVADVGRA